MADNGRSGARHQAVGPGRRSFWRRRQWGCVDEISALTVDDQESRHVGAPDGSQERLMQARATVIRRIQRD